MNPKKREILERLRAQSQRRIADFSHRLLSAPSVEKETLLAGIEVERQLAEFSEEGLEDPFW
jgi:hypothetical protein